MQPTRKGRQRQRAPCCLDVDDEDKHVDIDGDVDDRVFPAPRPPFDSALSLSGDRQELRGREHQLLSQPQLARRTSDAFERATRTTAISRSSDAAEQGQQQQ